MTADDADRWAAEIAATLPPLTAAEAAVVGQLAAALDTRRASQPTASSGPETAGGCAA